MSLKFAANLNFLFTDSLSIAERIRAACQAGFRAVEIPYPNGNEAEVIQAKKDLGIEVSLINIALGTEDGKLGEASVPGEEENFKKHLSDTVFLAKQLQCNKIHLMAGIVKKSHLDHLETYKRNLFYAANYLKGENLIGVIEPINKYAVPGYFMSDYELAIEVLKEINSENLKIMVDIYHLQHICGNLTNSLKNMGDLIGHFQIAQVPNRHEPDVEGELDFNYVFSLIKNSGYNDWIGCEYKPQTTTIEGLKWISKFGLKL